MYYLGETAMAKGYTGKVMSRGTCGLMVVKGTETPNPDINPLNPLCVPNGTVFPI
jgi:hypothetical protein